MKSLGFIWLGAALCHVDLPAASHMLSNTTTLGEACNVCQSSGAAYAVDQVHAQY